MTTLTTLLPVLERAPTGSARLDLLISYVVDDASPDDLRRIELFSSEGHVPERIAALLGYVPPPYTTQLDASMPGENIVLSMFSNAKGLWAAIHRRSSGAEDLHWGATEALARRIAALHGIAAVGGETTAEGSVRTGTVDIGDGDIDDLVSTQHPADTDDGEPAPWKILF